jgi:hypothetical protein
MDDNSLSKLRDAVLALSIGVPKPLSLEGFPAIQVPAEKMGVIGGESCSDGHNRLSLTSLEAVTKGASWACRCSRDATSWGSGWMVFNNAAENVARENKYDAPHRQILDLVLANDPS